VVLYGYYVDEHVMKIPHIDPKVQFNVLNPLRGRRQLVAVSLGCHALGACLPHPVMNDAYSIVAGASKRIACQKPPFNPDLVSEVEAFVDEWCDLYVQPLAHDSDLSVESWLPKTAYTQEKQQQLLQTAYAARPKRWQDMKSFIKDEFYDDFKPPRTINSRSDWFKTQVGPIFKLIEEQVFELPFFIKHVPAANRVDHLISQIEMLASETDETDYTSFEAHFKKIVLKCIPHRVYRRYVQKLLSRMSVKLFISYLENVIEGRQKLYFAKIIIDLIEAEMSGEMSTSLTNSITNCILYAWLMKKKHGRPASVCRGVFEGDDGINSREPHERLSSEDFSQVGFELKMKTSTDISGTDFCGLVFDTQERIPATDVVKAYVKFGWGFGAFISANRTRKLELLRAKSYSMLYQYTGCPVLHELAQYGLRVTKFISLDRFFRRNRAVRSYDMEWYREAYAKRAQYENVVMTQCPRTRAVIQARFGLSIAEQEAAESYLRTLNVLQPLDAIDRMWFNRSWVKNDLDYVKTIKRADLVLGRHPDLPVFSRFDNFGQAWWDEHGSQVKNGQVSGRSVFGL